MLENSRRVSRDRALIQVTDAAGPRLHLGQTSYRVGPARHQRSNLKRQPVVRVGWSPCYWLPPSYHHHQPSRRFHAAGLSLDPWTLGDMEWCDHCDAGALLLPAHEDNYCSGSRPRRPGHQHQSRSGPGLRLGGFMRSIHLACLDLEGHRVGRATRVHLQAVPVPATPPVGSLLPAGSPAEPMPIAEH